MIIILLLITYTSSKITNTTNFWSTQLNHPISYQTYAGYEQISWYYPSNTSGMFYQLFGAHGIDLTIPNHNIPLIIWLQGGPGASSQFAAHRQIGPVIIKNGIPKQNQWAWNYFGHLLFIDSPLNAGFSYFAGNRTGQIQVNSTDQTTNHLVNFLFNFYKSWPQLLKNPLYITGQSYAGHFIPVFTRKLMTNTSLIYYIGKIQGISIGDPWLDPINQINFYDSYLWSAGVIDNRFRDICRWFQISAINNIFQGNYKNATAFWDFIIDNQTTHSYYMGGMSIFAFRDYKDLDLKYAQILQNNKQKLGVDASISYIFANDNIQTAFDDDQTKSVVRDLVEVIRNFKTLIYNGQQDAIINTPGVLQFINSMKWSGITSWKLSQKKIWKINNQVVGWSKTFGNFWFVLVNKSGHMVPADQPRAAYDMMQHFFSGQKFQ